MRKIYEKRKYLATKRKKLEPRLTKIANLAQVGTHNLRKSQILRRWVHTTYENCKSCAGEELFIAKKLLNALIFQLAVPAREGFANIIKLFIGHARVQWQRNLVGKMCISIGVIFDIKA